MSAMAFSNNSQDKLEQMYSTILEIDAIASCCQQSRVGKGVPDALYVHVKVLHALDPLLQEIVMMDSFFQRGSLASAVLFRTNTSV
ncbi:hypothetical protein QUB56_10360 [Microcoleus sp. AR_TQ3_B6]|uniref:hypothetical protein n=1 Tax=Microcoleus sp. AR_TQ3_B6 TaxID=3055284 RepID=UPI002FD64EE4